MIQPSANPFPGLLFDQVVLYDYNPTPLESDIVNAQDELTGNASIRKTAQPDPDTIVELNKALASENSYGEDIMRCFIPHLGIVYFLEQQIVCHVSICLTCNNLRSSIPIPAEAGNSRGRGFSDQFRRFLNNLLVQHDFSHRIAD